MKKHPSILLLLILVGFLAAGLMQGRSALAQQDRPLVLLPIGESTGDGFIEIAAANASDGLVKIAILPAAFPAGSDAAAEAEARRSEVETTCKRRAPAGFACRVDLLPVFGRADAQDPDIVEMITTDLSAILILGGDQVNTMQILSGTPLENRLGELYRNGTIIAGSGASAAMLSTAMMAGPDPNFTGDSALEFGSTDVWNSTVRHGLPFGMENAIIVPEITQGDQIDRLLNAVVQPGVPPVAVGLGTKAGLRIVDGQRLQDVQGQSGVIIFDAGTYHAAAGVQYQDRANLLSIRNLLVHMLPPGDQSYDLSQRRLSLAAPTPQVERDFADLALPDGAGALFLGAGLDQNLEDNPILTEFLNQAGGLDARVLVVAVGYSSEESAQDLAGAYAAALSVPSETLVVPAEDSFQPPAVEEYTAMILVGDTRSLPDGYLERLAFVREAWLDGASILADNAATALTGAYFYPAGAGEPAQPEAFHQGSTGISPGLGLLPITIEPQIMTTGRWERMFAASFNHPEMLALGIPDHTALSIGASGTRVLGNDDLLILDLRQASLGLGPDGGLMVANGLMDVFAPGDLVIPQKADVDAAPIPAHTPAIPTMTFTPAPPTPTMEPSPTPLPPTEAPPPTPTQKPPRPTSTPLTQPPPPDPDDTNFMIVFAALTTIVIVAGVWINRSQRL